MIKFSFAVVLTALLSAAFSLFLPWWSIAPAAFAAAVALPQKPLPSFAAGFIGLLLLWGGLSAYLSMKNGHVLAHKVSLLILKSDQPMMLILLTACTGALVGGLAALAGSFVRRP